MAPRKQELTHIGHEISFDHPRFGSAIIGTIAVGEIVSSTHDLVIEGLMIDFDLSPEAEDGLTDRVNSLQPWLVTGSEYDNATVYLGDEKVSTNRVVPIRAGIVVPCPKVLPKKTYVSLEAFAEEMTNLYDAAASTHKKFGNDEHAGDAEAQFANLANNTDQLRDFAVSLSYARRLLKYGIMPNEIVSSDVAEVGFDTWMIARIAQLPNVKAKKFMKDEPMVNLIKERYVEENVAASLIRDALWRSMMFRVLPINPEDNVPFYLVWRDAINNNHDYTIPFSDSSGVVLSKAQVAGVLEKIYGLDDSDSRV